MSRPAEVRVITRGTSPRSASRGSLVCAALLAASGLLTAEPIKYVGDVARLPAGSDIAALGNTGVSLPRHASSSFWNPSLAGLLRTYEVSAEYADLYQGLSQQACFAVRVPIEGGLGASLVYLPFFSGDIDLHDSLAGTFQERLADPQLRADGSSRGTFQNNQNLLVLSLAKVFPLSLPRDPGVSLPRPFDLAAGVSFKGYWQTMNPDDKVRMGMNINLDGGVDARIGLDYDLTAKTVSREISIGAAWRDVLPGTVVWVHSVDEYQEPVKLTQLYGVSFTDVSGDLWADWTAAISIQRQYEVTYHAGIEAGFWKAVSFRAGWSDGVPSLGAGVRYRNYYIDYAFRFDEIAASILRLTAGVTF